MGSPALKASVELDEKDLIRGLAASEESLAASQEKAKLLAAQIALLEQAMAKASTDEIRSEHKLLQKSLQETKADAVAAERQLKALAAVKPPEVAAPPPSKLPDDSAAYEAHWKRLDEQERSQRAHAAIEARLNAPEPLREMPTASRARAEVRREYVASTGEVNGHGGQVGGNLAMRNAELMHSGRAIADMMTAGMSPVQALMMEAPRLFQALASSLGALLAPIALLAGGGMFVKWLHDGQEAAKALRLETAGIATNMNNVAGASAENLTKTLAAATEQLDKVTTAQSSTGNRILNTLTGGGVTKADVGAAMAVRGGIQHRLDETQGRKLDLDQRQFAGDPGVEAERLKLEFAEKRNDIYRQVAARQLVDGREAVRQAEAELALKMAILERTQQARQNEVQEETQGTAIRRYGKNVESELARARLERAQADLANGPQEGPEYQHNFNQVTTAKTAQEEADKRTRERNADLDRRTRNANLRGSADDVAYQKAVNDRDAIQGKLNDPATKADERKGLEAELAEAKAQMRGLAKQSYQKGFEIDKLGIQTDQGRGPQARKEAIEKELALIDRERKNNKEKNGDDALVDAQLSARAHALKTEKEDIEHAEKEALTAAKAQTTEMQLQSQGHAGQAQIEATRAGYEERIAKAIHEGKNDLAEQLKTQQKIATEEARLAEFLKTPAQKAQEARDATKHQNALTRMNDGARTHDADREGGTAHDVGWNGNPENAGGTAAGDSPDNLPADFTPQHMAGPSHMPGPLHVHDRRPQIDAGAQSAGKSDTAKGSDGEIIKAINDPHWVKTFGLKNK